jgi:hypothetical protein
MLVRDREAVQYKKARHPYMNGIARLRGVDSFRAVAYNYLNICD